MNKGEKQTQTTRSHKLSRLCIRNWHLICAFIILLFALYLRFWNVENTFEYGWDQARDAWKVRDVLTGTLVLNGPRTGIGHFHLGSLWYYFLAPFYFITRLDPIGAQYANIIINILNFIVFFWVTSRVFGKKEAVVASLIYAVSGYLIELGRVPWNVSPVFGVSALIYYSIHQIVLEEKYVYMVPLLALAGLFVHLHFAFVFLPSLIVLSLLFAKNKREVIRYGLWGLPLMLLFVLPLVLLDIEWKGGNGDLFHRFLKDYFIGGFHFRFFLIRLHDAFIQYHKILSIDNSAMWGKFIVPIIFTLISLTERGPVLKRNILFLLWFIVPAVMYSFYAGTTSEYYVLFNAPIVIYTLIYLMQKASSAKNLPKMVIQVVLLFLLFVYAYHTSLNHWVKPSYGGLAKQKNKVKECIANGCVKTYDEGQIDSYLYSIWTDEKYKNYPFK